MTNYDDPGWRPSLRGLWWYMIPIIGSAMRSRARQRSTNGLIDHRGAFLGIVVALLLVFMSLPFIEPWDDGGNEGWMVWVVLLIGIVSIGYIARIRRRPLATTSPEALAGSYRALFFVGLGIAAGPALWGFLSAMVVHSVWISLIGLAFGLIGLRMIAPGQGDIARRQREIANSGSSLSLVDALVSVPPAPRLL